MLIDGAAGVVEGVPSLIVEAAPVPLPTPFMARTFT